LCKDWDKDDLSASSEEEHNNDTSEISKNNLLQNDDYDLSD